MGIAARVAAVGWTRERGRMCDECREVQKIRYNQIKAEKDGQYRMILAHACK